MTDFTEALQTAGVKPRHLSRLMGVSRVTASNWIRGATQPHPLVSAQVDVLFRAVSTALEEGALPVSDKLPPEERSVKTLSTVKKYMDRVSQDDTEPEAE